MCRVQQCHVHGAQAGETDEAAAAVAAEGLAKLLLQQALARRQQLPGSCAALQDSEATKARQRLQAPQWEGSPAVHAGSPCCAWHHTDLTSLR